MICVIASLRPTEGTASAFEESAVKKLCKVASALMAVPKFFTDKQKMLERQITAGNEAAVKALLAAATERDHNKSTVFTAIAVAALDCADEGTKKLNDLVEPAVKAMTNAAKAAGAITEFADFLRKVSIGRATGYCLSTGTTVTTAQNAQELGCPPDIVETWADAATQLAAEFSDKGFKSVNTADAKAAGATNKCPILTGATDTTSNLWRINTPGTQKVFAGFVTATPPQQPRGGNNCDRQQSSKGIVLEDISRS
ncbi:Trypanosome variant surface glycoprotein (A-type), putative [Trypanosoma equiperdum]|uniref:Trypanosome variant surface glycoprotein (A-type), putative n=1 Tax=Trypanosoma equiperdum TaxID=5694 RepID=A0A1G4I9A5_TRYEQ|nr:Trypanosome variant surface glycoprotein (A-type), putative [Trypanosoma equiperdum]